MRKKIRRSAVSSAGISEVDLVLEICIFVVTLIDAPAQFLEALAERAEETQGAIEALEVVAGLGQVIHAVRVPAPERAVAVPRHQEELGLDPDLEPITGVGGAGRTALQVDARAIRVRPAVDMQVRREPGDAGLVGKRGISGRVDTRHHVVRIGPLPHAPDRPAGETRARSAPRPGTSRPARVSPWPRHGCPRTGRGGARSPPPRIGPPRRPASSRRCSWLRIDLHRSGGDTHESDKPRAGCSRIRCSIVDDKGRSSQ